jgi:N-acetylglucosamine malate deacetylase 1
MNKTVPTMLVIAPHPDDSILGAGGTMARFVSRNGRVVVLTIAAHRPPLYTDDVFRMTVEEAQNAHAVIGVSKSLFLNIPAQSLPKMDHHELNQAILQVLDQENPGIVLMPYFDRHCDHRAVFESAMVATRPTKGSGGIPVIAAYEVLSSTFNNAPHIEPNFTPNWIVEIGDFIDIKLKALQCCESQIGPIPHPRSCEAISALALFRGSQVGMTYGEGFHIIRMVAPPEMLT